MKRQKGRDLSQFYDKSPYTHRQVQKSNVTTNKNRNLNVDYTTIADRHRTVSLSNNSHPTGVGKPVYGISTFPLTARAKCNQKDAYLKKIVNNPPYKDRGPTANQSGEAKETF